jgi:hypothetical protein
MPVDENLLRKVQDHAVSHLSWSKLKTTNLHVHRDELEEGTVLAAHPPRNGFKLKKNSIMVFADDAPTFNWSHPCRYLLYDAKTGEQYDEVNEEFPPYLVKTPPAFVGFHLPVRLDISEQLWPVKPYLVCPYKFPKGERYAILFAGASNNRHTNDLEFLYRTLRDQYAFKAANIISLNYDGTLNYNGGPHPVVNWPGDNTPYRMPVNGPGTKAALENALDTVKAKLKADDFLLIHTNNHGGLDGPGKAYLCTFSGPAYYAADFGAKLATLPPHYCLMAMYEQCHSGGFNAPTVANSKAKYTTVASACVEANNSNGGPSFDPFARDWISAMAGHTPLGAALAFNPDSDANGRISALEAFNYAEAVHDPFDTPVYSHNVSAADDTFLAQRFVWWWAWWCFDIIKLVEPYYIKMPIPEFYLRFNEKLVPKLAELEVDLEKASDAQRAALAPKLKRAIEEALG